MSEQRFPHHIGLSGRTIGLLLRLFPTAFRDRFGEEMIAVFLDRRDALSSPGKLQRTTPSFAVARLTLATAIDVLYSALAERLRALRLQMSPRPVSSRFIAQTSRAPSPGGPSGATFIGRVASLCGDLRLAGRTFRKKPGFALAVVATLGIGIGANTTVFSVVHKVLLAPLPYPEPDRLVGVFRIDPDLTGVSPSPSRLAGLYAVPYPLYRDWAELSPVFENLGAYESTWSTLTGGDRPERTRISVVTSGVFATLGVSPMLGRRFLPEDDEIGAPHLVILSHGLWQRRFGAAPTALQQTVLLNGVVHTVVGVMPPTFEFPNGETELWATFDDQRKTATGREGGSLQVIARVTPRLSLAQAQTQMDIVSQRLGEVHPGERSHQVRLIPHKDLVVGGTRAGLWLLMGAVSLALLIACANIASLFLVRATARRRELAVRAALGAGRGRLVLHVVSEAAVLCLAGGAAGYGIAMVGVELFVASFPGGFPRAGEIAVDYRVLLFAGGITVLTGLLIAVLPALRSGHGSIAVGLHDEGRGLVGGRHRNRTHAVLVVSEIALAYALLVGAGLFVRSFARLSGVERGFVSENLLTVRVALPDRYRDSDDATRTFFREATERVASLAGAEVVATASEMPFVGGVSFPPTSIEGSAGIVQDAVHSSAVTPSYFRAMNIPLVAGRPLTTHDRQGTMPVALINQAMARRYWPEEDPVGRRLSPNASTGSPWVTVVGVVGDVRYRHAVDPFPEFYVPFEQRPTRSQTIVIRVGISPSVVASNARDALWAVDPGMPVDIERLDDVIVESQWVARPRFRAIMMGCFASAAALLALVGIYGLLAYTVAQRTHEIAIRIALGAGTPRVIRLMLGRGLLLTVAGLTIGIVFSLLAGRVIRALLFDMSPTDTTTLLGAGLLLLVAALAASFLPARRATSIDPIEALREG